MKVAILYLVVGAVLMAQAIARGLARPRSLEEVCTVLGMAAVWPVVLVVEARTWFRNRPSSPRQGDEPKEGNGT